MPMLGPRDFNEGVQPFLSPWHVKGQVLRSLTPHSDAENVPQHTLWLEPAGRICSSDETAGWTPGRGVGGMRTCTTEDLRVHEQDVGHGQKRRYPTPHFC